jgi:hypothetical protein
VETSSLSLKRDPILLTLLGLSPSHPADNQKDANNAATSLSTTLNTVATKANADENTVRNDLVKAIAAETAAAVALSLIPFESNFGSVLAGQILSQLTRPAIDLAINEPLNEYLQGIFRFRHVNPNMLVRAAKSGLVAWSDVEVLLRRSGLMDGDIALMQLYAAKQWKLPGLGQVQTMLKYGLIDEPWAKHLLDAVPYEPGIRDRLIATTWKKPSVAEAADWLDKGLISEDDFYGYAQNDGYQEPEAEHILDAKHQADLTKDRLACCRAAGTAFTKGNLSEADFENILKDMKLNDDRIQLWVFKYSIAKKQNFTAAEIASMEGAAL